ncbi:hypothetical protein [Aneurinibacillus tyrosinisolvens]|uniref:hypothetical protein n=1 Tax=Aneurinibacillus tyrosinisolvens TaxID=1443435 RepID=UPI00063F8B41|nr:hypothetical protein [Aneurinibacillus tyrosinisolvens]
MQFIIFAVLAVIAFIFLIVYNLRAAKKSEKKDKGNASPMPQEEMIDYIPERKALPMENPNQASGNQTISNQAAGNNDQAYRQALRSFVEQDAQTQTSETEQDKIADQEYREALRSMSKREGE